ncbi:hypothetical protein M949_0017 [Riemerella anatipestifer CH3]|nr:hypothetical protein M949_0017 [Riemerella anatipestifer CH3]
MTKLNKISELKTFLINFTIFPSPYFGNKIYYKKTESYKNPQYSIFKVKNIRFF